MVIEMSPRPIVSLTDGLNVGKKALFQTSHQQFIFVPCIALRLKLWGWGFDNKASVMCYTYI